MHAQDLPADSTAVEETASEDSVEQVPARKLNSIEASARYEYWSDGYPDRTYAYLQYGRIIKEHQLFFRLNSLWTNQQQGFQYEVDFYPKFGKRSYGYFNVAYSNFKIFAKFRTAAEVFKGINNGWEFSLGLRTVHIPDYNIYAATGTVGKYLGNWYIYGRPTVNFLETGVSLSILLEGRLYSGDGKSYMSAMIFNGADVGAVRDFNAIENTLGLDTWLIRFKTLQNIAENTDISFGIDYSALFNVAQDKWINVVGIDGTIRRRF